MKIDIKKIKPHTWVSVIMVIFVIINSILMAMGRPIINFSEEQITYVVNTVLNIVFIGYTAWKNQSVTETAQLADEVLYMLRDGKITKEEMESFIEKHKSDEVPTD